MNTKKLDKKIQEELNSVCTFKIKHYGAWRNKNNEKLNPLLPIGDEIKGIYLYPVIKEIYNFGRKPKPYNYFCYVICFKNSKIFKEDMEDLPKTDNLIKIYLKKSNIAIEILINLMMELL